jgi:hypothetical protein
MAIDGAPKFSTLVVAEISADFKGANIQLSGKAAFVDRGSGATHAWTKGEGAIWSPETLVQLNLLRAQMELDLARLHLQDYAPVGSTTASNPLPARVGGILEHLQTEADQM